MSAERPPRLAYLCLQPTVEGQGSHAHVHGIIDGLRALGWRVVLRQPDEATTTRGLLARLWTFMAVQADLWRRARGADAVYVRMHPVAAPTVWWARRRGIRVVVEVNGPEEDWLLAWPVLRRVGRLLRWLLATQLRAADHVVVVTSGLGEWAARTAGRAVPTTVIPNGADPTRFHPGATGGPAGLPDRYAVFVGELAPWQGIDVLLQAVQDPEWPDDLSLVIAGRGVMAGAVDAAAATDPRVVALGRVPFDQVPGLVAGAAVALVPSRDRAGTGVAPIKLFEALATGVPVIAADVPDSDRQPVSRLVPPDDAPAWARAVRDVHRQPAGPGCAGVSWADRAVDTATLLRGSAPR